MRILLTANASCVPPRGGATRSNLVWMDQMAGAGHGCRIVCGASGEGAELCFHESIAVFAVEDPSRRIQVLRQQIRAFRPEWVLVSSEDLGHGLLGLRSFSSAARDLGVAASVITKRVTQLENSLGVQLLVRSTRGLALTAAGDRLLPRFVRLMAEFDE